MHETSRAGSTSPASTIARSAERLPLALATSAGERYDAAAQLRGGELRAEALLCPTALSYTASGMLWEGDLAKRELASMLGW